MSGVQFGRIISAYPWVKTAAWDKREGVVATLELGGHRLEIHKKPYVNPRYTYPSRSSRFWLVVDGQQRGSESPRVSSILSEADAMLSWAQITNPAPAPEKG